jgi:hypothetical protein
MKTQSTSFILLTKLPLNLCSHMTYTKFTSQYLHCSGTGVTSNQPCFLHNSLGISSLTQCGLPIVLVHLYSHVETQESQITNSEFSLHLLLESAYHLVAPTYDYQAIDINTHK